MSLLLNVQLCLPLLYSQIFLIVDVCPNFQSHLNHIELSQYNTALLVAVSLSLCPILQQNILLMMQIKNYGFFRDYCADVYHLVKERQRNLISPKFWFYFLGTLLIPRVVLRRLVGIFKDTLGNQHASRKIPELTEG